MLTHCPTLGAGYGDPSGVRLVCRVPTFPFSHFFFPDFQGYYPPGGQYPQQPAYGQPPPGRTSYVVPSKLARNHMTRRISPTTTAVLRSTASANGYCQGKVRWHEWLYGMVRVLPYLPSGHHETQVLIAFLNSLAAVSLLSNNPTTSVTTKSNCPSIRAR